MRRLRSRGLLLAVLIGGCGVEPAGLGAGADGLPAPDFSLSALDGQRVSLAQLRGRSVIIDFWATWCAPCIHQIPVLNAFQEAHPDEAVVLGISVDEQGEEVVARFAAEHDIRYRVLLGDLELAQQYGAYGFPSLYVIGPDGRIDSSHVGVVSAQELEKALARTRAL